MLREAVEWSDEPPGEKKRKEQNNQCKEHLDQHGGPAQRFHCLYDGIR